MYTTGEISTALRGKLDRVSVENRAMPGDLERQRAVEEELDSKARSLVEEFHRDYARLPSALSSQMRDASAFLQRLLGNAKGYADVPIDDERACFMLATHLTWRAACPSVFTYTFSGPSPDAFRDRLTDKTCTLTVGTSGPLRDDIRLALARVAWALFTNPLIADYSEHLEERQRSIAFRLSTRLLGHNLPSVAVAPCVAQLEWIRRDIEKAVSAAQGTVCPEECQRYLRDAEERAVMGIPILEHYETLLRYITGATSVGGMFQPKKCGDDHSDDERQDQGEKPFPLADIFDPLDYLVKLHRVWYACGDQARAEVARAFEVVHAHEDISREIQEQRPLLREAVFNLVRNALDRVNNKDLAAGHGKVVVSSRITDGDLIVDVTDSGPGFGKHRKACRGLIADILATPDQDAFAEQVDELIRKRMEQVHEGEAIPGLGLGLLFCAAYARSREWARVGRKGSIEIDPGIDDTDPTHTGAAVHLHVPLMESPASGAAKKVREAVAGK
jgi:hypothetical protein